MCVRPGFEFDRLKNHPATLQGKVEKVQFYVSFDTVPLTAEREPMRFS